MSKRYAVLLYALVCLVLAACGQSPLAETPKAPDTALTTAATSPYASYDWYPGYGKVSLLRTSEGFCWLAGVEGRFDNSSYWASRALVEHVQGRWYLSVSHIQNAVAWAGAECVRWSAIKTPNAAQRTQLFSDRYLASLWSGSGEDWCKNSNTEAWWGDAVTMLTGVEGNLQKGRVWIDQSTDGFKPSTLSAQSCFSYSADGTVHGRAHSVFVGNPGTGNLPEFWAPGGKSVNYAHQFSVETGGYYMSLELAPTDQAFCYLTSIGDGTYRYGRGFNGPLDRVELYRGKNSAGKEV